MTDKLYAKFASSTVFFIHGNVSQQFTHSQHPHTSNHRSAFGTRARTGNSPVLKNHIVKTPFVNHPTISLPPPHSIHILAQLHPPPRRPIVLLHCPPTDDGSIRQSAMSFRVRASPVYNTGTPSTNNATPSTSTAAPANAHAANDSIASLLPIHRHQTYHTSQARHPSHAARSTRYQRFPPAASSSSSPATLPPFSPSAPAPAPGTTKMNLNSTSSCAPLQHSFCGADDLENAKLQLTDGLDNARFDQIRRAVLSNDACLSVKYTTKSNATSTRTLYPVAYALSNCELWHALAEHCRRTGVPIQQAIYGDLTFSERLSAMNVILPWLIQYSTCEDFSDASLLYTALNCGLYQVAFALLKKEPSAATYTVKGAKTFVHIVCSLIPVTTAVPSNNYKHTYASRYSQTQGPVHRTTKASASMSADVAADLVHELCLLGADVRRRDAVSVSPLMELIRSRRKMNCSRLSSSQQQQDENENRNNNNNNNNMNNNNNHLGYGLVSRRRRRYDEQDEKSSANRLEAVGLVIETLIMHGSTMKDVANFTLTSTERHVLRKKIANVQRRVCGTDVLNKWARQEEEDQHRHLMTNVPYWGSLPDEVIAKIFSHLSPVHITLGIGCACRGLKAITSRPEVWTHFDL